ncbi:transglycosylase SLT domain-containing protein [Pseudooceanicola sp. 200-1SW]|uniref:lytic transglycosylase domain-containing protein n=1 Tax=Pseudooceanicola sp. 200-1SW TaxID=3425949 RepID=UPI003D7F894A
MTGFRAVFALCTALLAPFGAAATTAEPAREGPARIAPRPLAWAFQAIARGDWDRAAQVAGRDGPLAQEIVEWARLRAGQGSASDLLVFLAAHPDWPGLALMRRVNEGAFASATPEQVRAFFDGQPAQTAEGALIHARALAQAGETAAAQAEAIRAWREMPMSEGLEARFLDSFGPALARHHAERAEAMFWAGAADDQKRMAARLPADLAALSEARRLARAGAEEADKAIADLPRAARADPGLAYARFRAHLAAGREAEAREILLAQSEIPGGLGQAELWGPERRLWARLTLFDDDKPEEAYVLAAHHQLSQGGTFADLEWLAGYIALNWLDDPATALTHFSALEKGVEGSISLGRAWYWIGRAREAMGDSDLAQTAYEAGAQHQTTFYGLLSAEKAGLPFDATLAGSEALPDWQGSAVEGAELRRAAMLLTASGQPVTGEIFLMHWAESLDPGDLARLAALLEARGEAHLAVRLGKLAAQENVILPRAYYPLHPLAEMPLPIAPEMSLAIARRESEFDPGVRSPVGAAGLMQLMPGTATHVANGLEIDHDPAWLTEDWRHNATLGGAYLAELGGEFWGNVVLMSIGYNAGPHRARAWIKDYGDPRDPDIDIVDWIETIPYRETRNYVQRVAESLPVYRARLGLDPLPIPFTAELQGSTLMPLAPQGE